MKPIKEFMLVAIKEAKKATKHGDYPIGAVIVRENTVLAKGRNKSKHKKDSTLHAELVAIQSAAKQFGRETLKHCTLYATNEPCAMCMGAVIYARMKGLVFGARIQDMKHFRQNNKGKHSWRTIDIRAKDVLRKSEHKLEIIEDFMREECQKLFDLLQ